MTVEPAEVAEASSAELRHHHRRASRLEAKMAKGQKRSGREAKKPKKTASKKPSGGSVGSVFEHPPGVTKKHHSKKA
jgi:hypothetical protein